MILSRRCQSPHRPTLGVAPAASRTYSPADFNHNGIVDLPDLAIVIDNWSL